jgi:hypothetical protein
MARVIYTEPSQKQRDVTATTQLFKPVTPAPVQKENLPPMKLVQQDVSQLEITSQALKQKQSQEMVQIMLHVSVS